MGIRKLEMLNEIRVFGLKVFHDSFIPQEGSRRGPSWLVVANTPHCDCIMKCGPNIYGDIDHKRCIVFATAIPLRTGGSGPPLHWGNGWAVGLGLRTFIRVWMHIDNDN